MPNPPISQKINFTISNENKESINSKQNKFPGLDRKEKIKTGISLSNQNINKSETEDESKSGLFNIPTFPSFFNDSNETMKKKKLKESFIKNENDNLKIDNLNQFCNLSQSQEPLKIGSTNNFIYSANPQNNFLFPPIFAKFPICHNYKNNLFINRYKFSDFSNFPLNNSM